MIMDQEGSLVGPYSQLISMMDESNQRGLVMSYGEIKLDQHWLK